MNNFDSDLIRKFVDPISQEEAFNKLKKGYPVQYIIGNVEFCDCIINVNESVLIPRFETEYLVNDLFDYIINFGLKMPKIIDVGTGSGCIAIALKKHMNCIVTALDISNKALDVAKLNALQNDVDINFLTGDINNYNFEEKFDVLVSNPPYVPFDGLVDEKIKYEPSEAIFAAEEGLYFYKIILQRSREFLNKKNIIAFEIGYNQSDAIIFLAKQYYPNAKIISKKDLNNYDRYIYIFND